ncbi:hypothetical protein R5W24_006532, partial [Gemmata sp. JC717]|uniref:hypothetical protein n=1 Tax=Gemmata algarum TaxID=2975278 RepID=UPI0021BAC813
PRGELQFSTLVARATEQSLWLSMDFNGLRAEGHQWLLQLFDHDERTLVTGRGATFALAVAECHKWFFASGMHG